MIKITASGTAGLQAVDDAGNKILCDAVSIVAGPPAVVYLGFLDFDASFTIDPAPAPPADPAAPAAPSTPAPAAS
jgi:hypothetical protein